MCITSYDLLFFGPVFPNCLYAPNTLKLYYSALRWSWSLNDTSLNVKYGIEGFEILFVCTYPHDMQCLVSVSLNDPNNPSTLELATPFARWSLSFSEFSLDIKCRIKYLRIFSMCREKRAKYLKTWAKMCKIWKYFEERQPHVCKYQMHKTSRICPGV